MIVEKIEPDKVKINKDGLYQSTQNNTLGFTRFKASLSMKTVGSSALSIEVATLTLGGSITCITVPACEAEFLSREGKRQEEALHHVQEEEESGQQKRNTKRGLGR